MVSILTFPRTLPDVILYCDGFDFQTDTKPSATNSGVGLIVENGCPLILAKYRTPKYFGSNFGTVMGWLDSVKSPPQPVLAWDVRHPHPLAYPNGISGMTRAGGGAFDGTCKLAAVDTDGYRLTLGASGGYLPDGFQLGPGDPLSLDWDESGGKSRRAYHRVSSVLAAANSSGVLQVEVRPATVGTYTTGVTVYLDKPCFKGYLVPGTDESPTSGDQVGVFKFQIKQDMRRL